MAFLLALAPVLASPRGLAQDQPVPPLRAPDLEGTVRTLADFPGRVQLLLFWQPANVRSRAALCAVADLAAGYEPAALATIVSGPEARAEIEKAAGACGRPVKVLVDAGRTGYGAYEIVALPTFMVVEAGRLKYKLAAFGREGLGDIEARLDEIYGRRRVAAAIEGPPDAVRRLGMARQLRKLGLASQAETTLRRLTADYPDFRPARVELSDLLEKAKEPRR